MFALPTADKLLKARINLIREPRFALLADILTVGECLLDPAVPTACTDGRNERFNPDFVAKLPMPELMFLVAHEAGHKMWRHLWVYRALFNEDAEVAGRACDYVINLMLHELDPNESFMKHPRLPNGERMGLFDLRFKGKDSYEVYKILKQEKEDHGGGQQGKPKRGGNMLDDHDHEGAASLSDAEREALEKEVDAAARRGMAKHKENTKNKGGGGGGLLRELDDMLNPKVDWRTALLDYVRSHCRGYDMSTWQRPNRRYMAMDMLMPSMYSERVGRLLNAIDTSGSVGGAMLTAFLTETVAQCHIAKPEGLDLLYWDGNVAAHETYDETTYDSLAASTKPKGGGGTSPSCITQYMKDEKMVPDCAIVLTDGYVGSDWGGEWPCPVLWVIVDNPSATPAVGKALHINSSRDL